MSKPEVLSGVATMKIEGICQEILSEQNAMNGLDQQRTAIERNIETKKQRLVFLDGQINGICEIDLDGVAVEKRRELVHAVMQEVAERRQRPPLPPKLVPATDEEATNTK